MHLNVIELTSKGYEIGSRGEEVAKFLGIGPNQSVVSVLRTKPPTFNFLFMLLADAFLCSPVFVFYFSHKIRVCPCILYKLYIKYAMKEMRTRAVCGIQGTHTLLIHVFRVIIGCSDLSPAQKIPTRDLASLFRVEDTKDDAQAHSHITQERMKKMKSCLLILHT